METTRLTAQLTERGEALTERVADLTEGLRVVVGPLTQAQGHVLLPIQGAVEELILVALRLARTGHEVARITRYGCSYTAHLEGPTTLLALAQGYVGGIEGARVSVCRA